MSQNKELKKKDMEKCVDVNRLYLFLQNRDKTGSLSSERMDLYREKPYSQSMIKIQCCFNAISHYQVQEKENKKVQHILIGENFSNRYPEAMGPFHFWSSRNRTSVSNLSKYSRSDMGDSLKMPWEMLTGPLLL